MRSVDGLRAGIKSVPIVIGLSSILVNEPARAQRPSCKLNYPVVVAKYTGMQARPGIAPGAVVYQRKGSGSSIWFQRLFKTGGKMGRPRFVPGIGWTEPGSLARYGKYYLLTGGRRAMKLFQLWGNGRIRRRMNLERMKIRGGAVVAVTGSLAWLAWRNQDLKAVRLSRVNLTRWRSTAPTSPHGMGGYYQTPRLTILKGSVYVAWAGSRGKRPNFAWRAKLPNRGVVVGARSVAHPGRGPAHPVGFTRVGGKVQLIFIHGAPRKTLYLETGETTYPRNLAPVGTLVPQAESAPVPGGTAIVYVDKKAIKLLLLDGAGKAAGTPRTLTAKGHRYKNPTVASEGRTLWIAYDQFGAGGGSTVIVRTASCR